MRFPKISCVELLRRREREVKQILFELTGPNITLPVIPGVRRQFHCS